MMPALRRLPVEEPKSEFEHTSAERLCFTMRWLRTEKSAIAVISAVPRGGFLVFVPAGFP